MKHKVRRLDGIAEEIQIESRFATDEGENIAELKMELANAIAWMRKQVITGTQYTELAYRMDMDRQLCALLVMDTEYRYGATIKAQIVFGRRLAERGISRADIVKRRVTIDPNGPSIRRVTIAPRQATLCDCTGKPYKKYVIADAEGRPYTLADL